MMSRTSLFKRGLVALSILTVACAPQAPAPPKTTEKPAAGATSAPAAKATTGAKPAGNAIAMGPQLAGSEEIAKDRTGSGGTLTIAMSAGNIPYPNTPPNEGFEGRRFVGYQLYDGILNYQLDQPDSVPKPGPGLA